MGQRASMSYCNKHWEDHENTFALNRHTHSQHVNILYSHISQHGHPHPVTHTSLLLDAGPRLNIKTAFPRYTWGFRVKARPAYL